VIVLEKENLRKIFTHYLIPNIASMFSLSLYIIPAYSVLNATGLLLGIGAGVVFSVARGTGDLRRANQVYNTAFWASPASGPFPPLPNYAPLSSACICCTVQQLPPQSKEEHLNKGHPFMH